LNKFPKEKSIEVKNTREPYLARVVFETQVGGSWKSTWGKCYYMPVLFFSRDLLPATDWDGAWLDEHLVSLSTAILCSDDTIHLCPYLTFPLHTQMKDRSETVEVAWANSLNTGMSICFPHISSSSAKLRKGLSSTVHLAGNQREILTIRGMFLKLPSSD